MFKKGDRVRVIKADWVTQVGDTGTVLEDNNYMPHIEFDRFVNGGTADGRGRRGYCHCQVADTEIELIPKQEEKAMFKVGDRVRATDNYQDDIKIGDTGKIIEDKSIRPYVEWDREIEGGHDALGKGKKRHCHSIPMRMLELIPTTILISTTARDAVASALRKCADTYAQRFKVAIEAIEGADRPEKVMKAKRELLVALVGEMPLSNKTCYFCSLHNGHCSECEYGKHNGICNVTEGNRFGVIDRIYKALRGIMPTYYTGEIYTDEAKLARHAEFLKLKAEFEGDKTL